MGSGRPDGAAYLLVVSLPNSAAMTLMGWILVLSLMLFVTAKNSLKASGRETGFV
jgi:hypothetical protein